MLDMNASSCGPSEEDTCATLLRSLPAQYESLVHAFRMSVTQFSFKDLVSKLNAEEVRKKDLSRIKTRQRYMLENDMRRKPSLKGAGLSERQAQVFSDIIVVSADTTRATAGKDT